MSTATIPNSTERGLGRRISLHPRAGTSSHFRWRAVYIAVGIGAALALLGGVLVLLGKRELGFVALGIGGFVAMIGALGIGEARDTMDLELSLFENGLQFADKKGTRHWSWDDVARIYIHSVRRARTSLVTHAYRLEMTDGRHEVIFSIADPAAAFEIVCQHTYPRIMKRVLGDFEAGNVVEFGPVTVHMDRGITFSRKQYQWSEVERSNIAHGVMTLAKRGGGWLKGQENCPQVPNVELLTRLIDARAAANGA